MKKRLYWNSCSFLDTEAILHNTALNKLFTNVENEPIDRNSYKASVGGSSNESIFRRTYIDILKNKFEFVLICWSHPERYFIVDNNVEIDYQKLKKDADEHFFKTKWDEQMYGYQHQIPHHSNISNDTLKFEPKGTDDTIFYTLSLHSLLKEKNIPHLFVNMGHLDSDVLTARQSWLEYINPKNYMSLNSDETILEKMKFSFVKHYLTISGNEFIKDKQIAEIKKISPDSLLPIINDDTNYLWVTDIAGHLGQRAIVDFSNKIYNHIIENNLLD